MFKALFTNSILENYKEVDPSDYDSDFPYAYKMSKKQAEKFANDINKSWEKSSDYWSIPNKKGSLAGYIPEDGIILLNAELNADLKAR